MAMRGEDGVAGERELVGECEFYSWSKCTVALMKNALRLYTHCFHWPGNTLHSIQQVNPLLGYNKSKPCTYTTQDAHKNKEFSRGFNYMQLSFFCVCDVHVQENSLQKAPTAVDYNCHDHSLQENSGGAEDCVPI